MKIDPQKALDVATAVVKICNVDVIDMFKSCGAAYKGMGESPYKDAIKEAFKKTESSYNDTESGFMKILKGYTNSLTEQLPEFKQLIDKTATSLDVVKPGVTEETVKGFDFGSMGL